MLTVMLLERSTKLLARPKLLFLSSLLLHKLHRHAARRDADQNTWSGNYLNHLIGPGVSNPVTDL